MMPGEIEILEMDGRHVKDVARIHRTELPKDFCSVLGTRFLEEVYYPHFLGLEGRVGLVAVSGGRVAGFVTSYSAEGYYSRLLKENLKSMLLAGLRAAIRNPFFLVYTVLVSMILFGGKAYCFGRDEAELLYIAVDRESQGRKVGSRLVSGMCRSLKAQGYRRCVAKTMGDDAAANGFYLKNGFTLIHAAYGRVWYAREC